MTEPADHDLHEVPLIATLLGVAVGLVVVMSGHWRKGLWMVGVSVIAAASMRLVLPPRRVGLLAVRGRTFDVAVLATLGMSIVVLAALVPTTLH